MLFLFTLLAGCSSYQLTGRVVDGPVTMAEVVSELPEPIAQGASLPGAEIVVVSDPDRVNRKEIGRATSRADGTFSVPIDALGAGTLEYRVSIVVRRRDFESAELITMLPGRNKQLAVSLQRGDDRRPGQESVVDETLRLAEPYMQH